jgi:hypothetical protein
MRVKFERGLTPKVITDTLRRYIEENELLIGSVNVFIQLYGEDGKTVNDFKDQSMVVFSPTQKCKDEYSEYAANLRRKSIKAVKNDRVEAAL